MYVQTNQLASSMASSFLAFRRLRIGEKIHKYAVFHRIYLSGVCESSVLNDFLWEFVENCQLIDNREFWRVHNAYGPCCVYLLAVFDFADVVILLLPHVLQSKITKICLFMWIGFETRSKSSSWTNRFVFFSSIFLFLYLIINKTFGIFIQILCFMLSPSLLVVVVVVVVVFFLFSFSCQPNKLIICNRYTIIQIQRRNDARRFLSFVWLLSHCITYFDDINTIYLQQEKTKRKKIWSKRRAEAEKNKRKSLNRADFKEIVY